MDALAGYRHREFRGIEELTNAATALIERPGASAAQRPLSPHGAAITERTVRQYLSEDLLGEPARQAGTSLVFNYGHLLRLLAVKKLLAAHWSVIKIKEFMTTLDITALEQLVGGAPASDAQSESAARETSEAMERTTNLRERQHPITDAAFDRAAPLSLPPPLAFEAARHAERPSIEWIELTPGLEIRIRRGFRAPRDQEEKERLAARFWSVVNRHTEKKA